MAGSIESAARLGKAQREHGDMEYEEPAPAQVSVTDEAVLVCCCMLLCRGEHSQEVISLAC